MIHTQPLTPDRSPFIYDRFSEAEYERRHQLAREFMTERGYDSLLIAGSSAVWDRGWSNIRWLTNMIGTMENPAYCVFPVVGEPMVTVMNLSSSNPDRRARAIIEDIRGALRGISRVVERLKELHPKPQRVGVVPVSYYTHLPADDWTTLHAEFPETEFDVVSDEFWRLRMALSAEEVAELEKSARFADVAHEAIRAEARVGMTELDVFALVYRACYDAGAEHPSMLLLATGPTDGSVAAFQRAHPLHRSLAHGDIITTELGPRSQTGYEAQSGRSFFFGEPPSRYREMFDIARATQDRIVGRYRPGSTEVDIRTAGSLIEERGFIRETVLVHGIVNPIDAGPMAGSYFRPDKQFTLAPGMPGCIEISVLEPDRTRAVYLGDTYVVTDGEARCLNRFPREMIVL